MHTKNLLNKPNELVTKCTHENSKAPGSYHWAFVIFIYLFIYAFVYSFIYLFIF